MRSSYIFNQQKIKLDTSFVSVWEGPRAPSFPRATFCIVLNFFQELSFFLKFPRPLTFLPGESHHKLPPQPFLEQGGSGAPSPCPHPICRDKVLCHLSGSGRTGASDLEPPFCDVRTKAWCLPPGQAFPILLLRTRDPRRPLLAAVLSKWRKSRPLRFFFPCVFFVF